MKKTKVGKTAGVDKVGRYLLRADMDDAASRLTRCYNKRLRGGRKCGRMDLLSRYSRKVICAIELERSDITTGHQ